MAGASLWRSRADVRRGRGRMMLGVGWRSGRPGAVTSIELPRTQLEASSTVVYAGPTGWSSELPGVNRTFPHPAHAGTMNEARQSPRRGFIAGQATRFTLRSPEMGVDSPCVALGAAPAGACISGSWMTTGQRGEACGSLEARRAGALRARRRPPPSWTLPPSSFPRRRTPPCRRARRPRAAPCASGTLPARSPRTGRAEGRCRRWR